MRPLPIASCSSPAITWAPTPFPGRLRPRCWPRQGVVAYGRRPKNPVQLEEATSSLSSDGEEGPLPLGDGRYELPRPPAAAIDELILQQQKRGRGRPRGRRNRPADAGAAAAEAAARHEPADGSGSEDGAQGLLLRGDGEQYAGSDYEDGPEGAAVGEGGESDEDEYDEDDDEELDETDEEGGTGGTGAPGPTELVFRLERRGEGWGEELFPHITMEKRPLLSKSKHKCQHPDPWEEGSLEYYLIEVGVPPNDVDRVVEQAVAWRFTPGGRALIDRRRRSRVERNVRLVVQHLEMEGGVPFGPKGMGAILSRVPEIMLCKPTTNDRWDRRAVELVAYQHVHGHCNVPEDWGPNPELGAWVKRQRVARAAGQLSDDRLAILQGLGFEFGEVAQMTDEWEHRFDQLIDWMLWHKENQQRFSWLGIDWGYRGGITARELALWVRLQGEFRRRNLLPAEAIKRFEAIGVDWDCRQEGTAAEREWMAQFSRLLYVIERHNTVTRPYLLQTARLGRPKAGGGAAGGGGGGVGAPGMGLRGGPAGSLALDEEEEVAEEEVYHTSSSAAHRGRAKLQQELAARRRALAVADLRCEVGLRYWLERQRWLWRQGRLPTEQVLMLQLAGVDMERYTSAQWQSEAHKAATLLQRSQVSLTAPPAAAAAAPPPPPPPSAPQQQQQQQPAGPGALAARGPGGVRPVGRGLVPAGGWSQGPPQQQQQQQQAPAYTPTVGAFRGRIAQAAPAAALSSPLPQPGGPPPSSPILPTHGATQPAEGGPSCLRLRVRRWVQTQAALFHEGHLSPAQLRYLTFLGITWVVSDEVMHMGEAAWRARFEQLLALCKEAAADGVPPAAAAAVVADRELREWLRHQRGLHALGLLREDRRKLLGALGVGWGHPRGQAERAWDARLSELLAFKAEHGHLEVPEGYGPYPHLAAWVAAQRRLMWVEGGMDPGAAAQLSAIGITPLPPAAPGGQ